MPTPFADPYSALSQGLMQGYQTGMAQRQFQSQQTQQAQQMKMEQERLDLAKQQAQLNSVLTKMDTYHKLINLDIPELSNPAMNGMLGLFKEHANTLGINGEQVPQNVTYDSSTDKPFLQELKKLSEAMRKQDITQEDFIIGARGIAMRYHNEKNKTAINETANSLIKQEEEYRKKREGFKQGELQAQSLGLSPDSPDYTAMIAGNEQTRKLIEERADKYKNKTDNQLIAMSLEGDQKAKAILNEKMRLKDGGMQLSPDAIKALGERFDITGEIPGMGMGRAATEARSKVLNKWAEDLNRTGNTVADQTAKQAAYKASKAELTKLQSQRGTVMAFATTAEKNLALVADLSEKVDRTGVPAINRWLLAGKRSLAGDPDVAKFDAAVRTAINEYAKVTSSATGGGVTSDQARKEVESMLNTAQNKEQVQQVIGLLRQEMGNRKTGYDEQISIIKQAISGSTQSNEAARPKGLTPDFKQAPDGKWYKKDPTRPGKYLMYTGE